MESILSAEKLTKQFTNHLALDNLTVSVPKGSIYGLLGPNGAGKTTFIRIINQIMAPDEGTVTFNGEPLRPKHIERIGYLPEERGLYKKMKVGEQSLYLTQLKGLSRSEATRRLHAWFEKFGIESWWDKKIEELSKGMAQKVQFITTVLHEPELLIFDEPFSGFDPINANLMKKEIRELRDRGSTIIFSTHNMASVEEVCDHIALINEAKIVVEGPIEKIRNKYAPDIYEIEFEGEFNRPEVAMTPDYEIQSIKKSNGINIMRVKRLNDNFTTNDLIKSFINKGKMLSFRQIKPSMNNIFIGLVEGTEVEPE
ncbi:MAG: ATP-binding cassette domain-containing protein [Candidatus Delongbacteria bacterium]|jgi:ABC-2 type transport system ATP-binding protein|nr:ATP-binding cassette domain-containing protein [Candidatus Delongbacteria bacterium]